MSNRWWKVALAAVAVLGAGACGGAASSDGPVTLTYAVWDKEQVPAMEKIAAEFEKSHPDVDVKVQLTSNKEYWTKLQTAVTGGSAPDVFWMNGPRFQLYASQGVLLPLDEQIAAAGVDTGAYPRQLVDLYTFEDKKYGLPKDFDTIGLWYNKALFDAAGVAHPTADWTWDDLREAARKLTDPAKGQYGIAAAADSQANYYNTIFQAGGSVIAPDGKKSGFGDPATIEGLRFWVDLINKDKVSPTVQQMSDTEPAQMFSSGKVAMYYGGSWEAVGFAKNADLTGKVDVAPLPRGKQEAVVIHGLSNVVYAKSEHPEQAAQFAVFAGSREAQRIQAETGAVISAHDGTQEGWLKAMPQYRLQSFLDQVPDSVPLPRSKNTAAWTKKTEESLLKAWSGEQDVAEVARSLAEAVDAELGNEK
ncbi:ABC transporter substrate-binding protein [Saccharothrix algeriensis]|uniref:Multiple sugar transport system substrate-binding protein n=1 Tax=Saccharothrix algeriensis TaxID=173560 RepID=A0ABS2S127_9PSEU|nr:sugar ABC transporter substrate-binding protein [Saccharothrix algeriensis]MBM7809938.1 multiple sugar transport system substrate-binding protein [Saccharothrix algeriensis]